MGPGSIYIRLSFAMHGFQSLQPSSGIGVVDNGRGGNLLLQRNQQPGFR
jgi:hypothetical protein